MKKLFAIAFTCVYLLLTVGVINDTHYCMGRINLSFKGLNSANYNALYESTAGIQEKRMHERNSAEFFIISNFYSEAFIVFLA